MRSWVTALLLAPTVAFAALPPAQNDTFSGSDDFDCRISLKAIKQRTPKFADYPAAAEPSFRPAGLVITPDIRFVRSNMRRSYAGGANFAGHYTVAAVFAGTSGMMWAIVNARTGRVIHDARGSWWFGDLDDDADRGSGAGEDYPGLRFRRDSRLIIFLGKSDGGDDPEGVAYCEWKADHLKRVAFIPKAKSCFQRPLDR